jgi:hypothetical protein
MYDLPSAVLIQVELIQAGAKMLCSKIHKLINFVWNESDFKQQWRTVVPVYMYCNSSD